MAGYEILILYRDSDSRSTAV